MRRLIILFTVMIFSFYNSAIAEDRPFRHSQLYYEIQARKWMKELDQKAKKSLKTKEELEQLSQLKNFRSLSNKQKIRLNDRRRVESIMGKQFLK